MSVRFVEEETDRAEVRRLAESLGAVVVSGRPVDAAAALQMNIARVFIEANNDVGAAMECAQAFGERLIEYIEENWRVKRGRN